jgi:RNA polymerase sigma factor (sigma-70 family)
MMGFIDEGDRELAAARTDPEAFAAFYRRYAEDVLRYFAVRVQDPEAAADLMAETFAAALLAVRRYRPRHDGSAAAWLFTIARSKLIDAARRGRVEAKALERLALDPLVLEDDDLQRVADLADLERSDGRLSELLANLPPKQRESLLARVVDERGYREIASNLACSELVVRKRVSRALAFLRARWIGD